MLYFPAASDEQLYYSFQGKPRLVVCNQGDAEQQKKYWRPTIGKH